MAVFIWIPGLIINVVLNFIWVPKYGIKGAAAASLLAYFSIFILHYWYFNKLTGEKIKNLLFIRREELKELFIVAKNKFISLKNG